MKNKTKHIVIVEDQKLFVSGMLELIKKLDGVEVVAVTDNHEGLEKILAAQKIDILLLDLNLVGKTGFEILKSIRKDYPDLYIAILTMYDSPNVVEKTKKLGANAFLTKNTSTDELQEVFLSAGNKFYTSKSLAEKKVNFDAIENDNFPQKAKLTPRELEIIKLYAQGKNKFEIADILCISPKTVETHKNNIFKKLGLHSIADLVRFAHENGLV